METDERSTFLMKMYDQMFNDIDRQHKIVWQVIGLLLGSFAFLALSEKKFIPIDIAISLVTLLAMWVLAHVYDSNYWYNRNLVIIANIERQFLRVSDLKEIHYYFGRHRDVNAVQTSLKIQLYLCWTIIAIFLLYHFIVKIVPGFSIPWKDSTIDWLAILPYVSTIAIYFLLVNWIKNKRRKNYTEFIANSPGKEIMTENINYGDGHPSK